MIDAASGTTALLAEPPTRMNAGHRREPSLSRWQIAELTETDIAAMAPQQLLTIVDRTSHLAVPPRLRDQGLCDQRTLRHLVRLARRTCRRQGY